MANSLKAITGIDASLDQLPLEKRKSNTMYRPTGDAFTAQEIAKLEAYINEYTSSVSNSVLVASSCEATGQAQKDCLSSWGKALVSRAFSRVLDASENTAIDNLISGAGGSVDEQASIVKDILYGAFMSPSFLYGVELGERDIAGGAQRELSGREIAERLSIAILGRMPDDTLLTNAQQLKDSSFRLSTFERLWETEEARNAIGEFVLDWLGAAESDIKNKAELHLDGLPDQFETAIRKSAIDSVISVLKSENPTLNGLLTTKAYLPDDAVQLITAEKLVNTSITGVGSDQCNTTTQCKVTFGDTANDCSMSASNMSVCMCDGQRCDTLFPINNDDDALRFGDNNQSNRQGLMMHPYVLSSLTKQTGSSAFQIGINYKKTMLCDEVPEPPVGAEEKALELAPAGSSAIEELKYKTNAGPVCLGCHLQFNDLGFAFMPFDPLGRWEQEDPNLMAAWTDLHGKIPTFRGQELNFSSPSDLSARFSQDPQVLGCFAQASMEWVLGRELIPQEKSSVEAINNIAQTTNGKIYDIFKAIVASPEFTRVFTSEAN